MIYHPELRVLVLESDETSRAAQCQIIRNCGHETYSAASSSEALGILKTRKIDAVFCDTKLPLDTLSGDALLQTLVQDWPDSKVIVVSAVMDYDRKMNLKNQGAAACLRKPLTEVQIDCTIETLYPDSYDYELAA